MGTRAVWTLPDGRTDEAVAVELGASAEMAGFRSRRYPWRSGLIARSHARPTLLATAKEFCQKCQNY